MGEELKGKGDNCSRITRITRIGKMDGNGKKVGKKGDSKKKKI